MRLEQKRERRKKDILLDKERKKKRERKKEEEEKELERKSGKSCRSQSKVLWRFLWRLHSSSKIFSTIISLQKSLILNVLPE